MISQYFLIIQIYITLIVSQVFRFFFRICSSKCVIDPELTFIVRQVFRFCSSRFVIDSEFCHPSITNDCQNYLIGRNEQSAFLITYLCFRLWVSWKLVATASNNASSIVKASQVPCLRKPLSY